ncbi:MAG: hypothetical protein DELT_02608 [Desulfovibrio sp.]
MAKTFAEIKTMNDKKISMIPVAKDLVDFAKSTPITEEELREVARRFKATAPTDTLKRRRGVLATIAALGGIFAIPPK